MTANYNEVDSISVCKKCPVQGKVLQVYVGCAMRTKKVKDKIKSLLLLVRDGAHSAPYQHFNNNFLDDRTPKNGWGK